MKKTNRRPSGQTWASISSGGNRRQSHTRIKLSEVALKTWCIIDEGGQDATSCPQFAHALCWLADDRAVQGEQSRNKGHTGCSHGDTLQHFFFSSWNCFAVSSRKFTWLISILMSQSVSEIFEKLHLFFCCFFLKGSLPKECFSPLKTINGFSSSYSCKCFWKCFMLFFSKGKLTELFSNDNIFFLNLSKNNFFLKNLWAFWKRLCLPELY